MRTPRSLASLCVLVATVLAGAPPAAAQDGAVELSWRSCGRAAVAAAQCATAALPLDYDRPRGATLDVHVARVAASDPKRRIGTLFLNFGGPGVAMAEYVETFGRGLFPALGARYDIVGVDPRGTGGTEGAIDCRVDQESQGLYAQPFPSPLGLDAVALLTRARRYVHRCLALTDRRLVRHFSTANTARDLDTVRAALGESQLHFLGFSYGTFLGATYAALFPREVGRMVLDGPVDATAYANHPSRNLLEQTAAFERALDRFFAACTADQPACSAFGGEDPARDFEALLARVDAAPIPAAGSGDRRPVDGDDVRAAAMGALYSSGEWGRLGYALARAQAGDGAEIRALADAFYGRERGGGFDPLLDRYFVLGAVEQRFPRDVREAMRAGDRARGAFAHFSTNAGYVDAYYALWPVRDRDAFHGPFRLTASATTPLVTAVTNDPATPFQGARRLVRDLGNARLLTVRADGHTAYGSTGPCADAAIEGYLLQGTLPARGAVCAGRQQFTRYQPHATIAAARSVLRRP